MTKEFTPRIGAVKGKDGALLTSKQDIVKRWEEYTSRLYEKDPSIDEQHTIGPYEDEPLIIKEEVLWTIQHIANGKSPGTDDIPIELIKNAGEEIVNKILKLFNLVWKLKEWPEG